MFATAYARLAVPRAPGILLSLPPHLSAVGKQRLQMHTLSHPYLRGRGEQNPGPHSLTASALPIEPFP